MSNPSITSQTVHLRRPSDLITAVPYLLGFHPDPGSIVILGIHDRTVAFTVRLDAPAHPMPSSTRPRSGFVSPGQSPTPTLTPSSSSGTCPPTATGPCFWSAPPHPSPCWRSSASTTAAGGR